MSNAMQVLLIGLGFAVVVFLCVLTEILWCRHEERKRRKPYTVGEDSPKVIDSARLSKALRREKE